ncbi:hypothetical protein N2152v2_001103 [Parachlorella kessleri]
MSRTHQSNDSSSSGGAERYELKEVIGRGSFGDVYRGEDDIVEIQKEISMLKTCRSPNITQYYGSSVIPGTTQLMIIMELMAVSVSDMVDDENGGAPLPEPCIAYVLREVLNALVYLHSEHRIHRDIKAANILVSRDGLVKVSDFGVSAQLSGTVSKRRTFVGSPLWMAPEVIEQSPDTAAPGTQATSPDGYDEAADIWSLGITAIEMAKGQPPRSNISSFRLLFMIVQKDPPSLEGNFSTDFKDFDPSARPTADELLEHEFVRNAQRPPDFEGIIADFLRRRPSVEQRRAAGQYGTVTGANYGTVPRWDFANNTAATVKAQPSRHAVGEGATINGNHAAIEEEQEGEQRTASSARAVSAAQPSEAAGEDGQAAGFSQFDTVKAAAKPAPPTAAAALGQASASYGNGTGTVRALAPQRENSSRASESGTLRRVEAPSNPTMADRPAAGSEGWVTAPSNAAPAANHGLGSVPDTAPLRSLIQPALATASGSSPQAAAVAVEALAALSRLEAVRPGASRSLVGDMLAMLSVSSSPSLQPLKSSAEAVFGAGGPDSTATMPDMGPLGNFLLARWRETTAKERMGQGWQFSN